MEDTDPTVQTTITLRQSQLDVARRGVKRGEAKNVSQYIGKALNHVDTTSTLFVAEGE